MLNLKTNPVSYDLNIHKLAQKLYQPLCTLWGLDVERTEEADRFEAFGRVYKRNGKPVHFKAETLKDYKDVLWNDNYAAMFFFGVGEDITYDGAYGLIDVHLVFMVDLSKLNSHKENPYRSDVEVRKDVFDMLYPNPGYQFTFKGESLGMDRTFQGYEMNNKWDFNSHPKHCFRYDLQLRFNT